MNAFEKQQNEWIHTNPHVMLSPYDFDCVTVLLPGHILSAMLADFCSFLYDFRTKRALSGEISFMNLLHRFIDLFLDNLIAESGTSNRIYGFQFPYVTDHFRCL